MSFDSDFDDDIDKLLDEIDTAGTTKKKTSSSKPTATGGEGADGKTDEISTPAVADPVQPPVKKLTLNSDGNGFKVNYGGGGFKLSDLKNKAPTFGSPTKDPLKSVRFENASLENQSTKSTTSKPNLISNLLQGPGDFDTSISPNPSPTPNFMSTPKAFGAGIATGTGSGKSDWLGISGSVGGGGDISLSPTLSPKRKPGLPSTTNTTVNFDDDDDVDELLQSVNEPRGKSSKTSGSSGTGTETGIGIGNKKERENPPSPTKTAPSAMKSAKGTLGFDLDDDFWPKPSKPVTSSTTPAPSILNTKNETFDKPEPGSDFRSRLLQKAALSRESTGTNESPLDGVPSSISRPQQQQAKATITPPTSYIQQQQQPQQQSSGKSIVDVLPFLSKKPSGVEEAEPMSFETNQERSLPPNTYSNPPAQATTTGTRTVKKKSAGSAVSSSAPMPPHVNVEMTRPHNTLNLPSHLIDEDELKSMCNSLKSLYMTQLEMQEKSYQEQLDCASQSHMRKEELLREEIKLMHKEYDARLERLKNELLDTESKLPQRYQNELSAMSSFTQHLQNQMKYQGEKSLSYTPNITLTNQNASELNSPRGVQNVNANDSGPTPIAFNTANIVQDIDKILQERLNTFLQTVESSLPKLVENTLGQQLPHLKMGNGNDNDGEIPKELMMKLDGLQKKLDSFAKFKMEEDSKKNMQMIESEKKLQGELARLHKQQRKMKETVVKATVTSIAQTMQYTNEESASKKDKIASQLKEFRKDVRRVLYDLEAKNEVAQKSNVNLEEDQKQIMKSMRELQTLIQVQNARSNLTSELTNLSMIHPHVNSSQQAQNQNQNQHFLQQQQQQNEMELRLLKEERNTLSDSIAQMNVERRKLNEERINLERDKMDFEREKNRLRDLEVEFRVKIAEAEDMKKQAEEVRKVESSKAVEGSRRLSELDKERAALKEQQYTSDSRLRIREQKLIQEKTELMREKEFLEKLRDQSLCPGCMKSLSTFNIANLSRSEGDGLDISTVSTTGDFSSKLIQQQQLSHPFVIPNPEDVAYFQKESLRLDDLYYKHFNTK